MKEDKVQKNHCKIEEEYHMNNSYQMDRQWQISLINPNALNFKKERKR